MSENIKEIDFESIREIWNKYKLKDGVTLKNKPYLQRVMLDTVTNQYNFELGISTEIDIPPKHQPDNNKIVLPSAINFNTDIEKEVEFNTIFNKPQIYEASGNLFIFVGEQMSKIYLTRKEDAYGRPMYYVDAVQTISLFHVKE